MSSGPAIGARRGRSCTATSPPGFPPRCCSRIGRTGSPMRCSLATPALGRVPALQQGPGRRARRGHRRGQGYGDEPGRARRLRAGDQRGRGPAGLSRHRRPRARPRGRAPPGGRDRPGHGRDAQAGAGRRLLRLGERLLRAELAGGFWGPNYARLLAVKDRYDPDGLFFVHHGVGSERWSADGFTWLG